MGSNADFEEVNDFEMYETEMLTPDGSNKIALAHEAVANSIDIAGLEQMSGSTPTTGYFTVATVSNHTEISFYAGDIPSGVAVKVSYQYEVSAKVAKIDNRNSTRGEAILAWPVYAGYDGSCELQSAIIGHFVVHVFNARLTANPGLDSSYKSANTFAFTLAAINKICGLAA